MSNGAQEYVDILFGQFRDKMQESLASATANADEDLAEKALVAFSVETYAHADRPLAVDGMTTGAIAIISDGLDVGESTPGSGCLAMYKSSPDDWYRVADNALVVT